MKSNQNYIIKLLNRLRRDIGLDNQAEASRYFYSVIAYAYKRAGYSLSYYKDNSITITSDNLEYHKIEYDNLWLPSYNIKQIRG